MSHGKRRRAENKKPPGRRWSQLWLIPLVVLVALGAIIVLMVPPDSLRSKTITRAAPAPANVPAPPGERPTPHDVSLATHDTAPELSLATNLSGMTDAEKAVYYQNFASQLLEKGRYAEAIAQYRMAVKLSPDDEDAHYNLALALGKGRDVAGARKEYLEALRLYPDYPEAHNNLGNLLLAQGNLEDAVTHFKAALENTPDDPSLHNNLGHALARQGKLAEAVSAFREALRLKPDYVEAHYNLGQAYLKQNQPSAAASEFAEVLKSQPDFEPAQSGLAKARQLQSP